MHSRFWDFLELVHSRGIPFTLMGNPFHFSDEVCQRMDTTFNLKDHLWTLFLYEKGLFKIPEGLDEDTIYDGCNCGNCHFTISAEGRLMACRRFESYVGTVDEELYDVFHSPKMDAYRQHERFEKCCQCELLRFCRGCPAVAYGYTKRSTSGRFDTSKNFYTPDPQCWKEVKSN